MVENVFNVYFSDSGWVQSVADSDHSLDLISLPDSPIEPVSPEHAFGSRVEYHRDHGGDYGYGLAEMWSPLPTRQQHSKQPMASRDGRVVASQQGQRRGRTSDMPDITFSASDWGAPSGASYQAKKQSRYENRKEKALQQYMQPLDNENASVKDLLDAFSASPPYMSPECSRVHSIADEANESPENNEIHASMGPMRSTRPEISDYTLAAPEVVIMPITCSRIFETQPTPSRATAQTRAVASAEVGNVSKPGVRTVRRVTDEASSNLAKDLASKLAQRRAWETGDTNVEKENPIYQRPPLLDSNEHTVGKIVKKQDISHDDSACASRQNAPRQESSPGTKVGTPGTATVRSREDKMGSTPIRRSDDAAVRRASLADKAIHPSASQLHISNAVKPTEAQSGSPLERSLLLPSPPKRSSDAMSVQIIEAKMLGARDGGGLPDPCCWISLHHRSKLARDSDGRLNDNVGEVSTMEMKFQHTMRPQFKSPPIKKAQDPVWNSSVSLNSAYQVLTFTGKMIQHESASLELLSGHCTHLFLTVHDGGERKNSFLGQAVIMDIMPGALIDRWITLQRRDGSPQLDSVGRVSSVRIKLSYISQAPNAHDAPHETAILSDRKQSSYQEFPCRESRNLYALRFSADQQSSAQRLQAFARRIIANRALRLILFHARLQHSEAHGDDDHSHGLNLQTKMEVDNNYKAPRYGKAGEPSIRIAADVVACSSDYAEDMSLFNSYHNGINRGLPQVWTEDDKENSEYMMEFALRNRHSVVQAEALLNLGLGLLDGNDETRNDQAHKYIHESFDVMKTLKPSELQTDRAQHILGLMTQRGVFKERPDLASTLTDLSKASRKSMSHPPVRHSPPAQWPGSATRLLENRPGKIMTGREQGQVSPGTVMATIAGSSRPLSHANELKEILTEWKTPREMEKEYKTLCKEGTLRPQTYRELREMPASKAADMLRVKMSLSPPQSRAHVETTTLGRLIDSCEEFEQAVQQHSRPPCLSTVSKKLPSSSKTAWSSAEENRRHSTSSMSSAGTRNSRLSKIEAQLRALDRFETFGAYL